MLSQRQVLLVKAESTHGTDPTPSASADVVVVEQLRRSFPTEVIDPVPGKPSLSPAQPIIGRKMASWTFQVPIKGSGAAGTAPEFGPLLTACGLDEVIVASTSVTYTPGADPTSMTTCPSCTVYDYVDGLLYEANAVRGNARLVLAAGQRGMLEFEMMGIPVDPVDATLATPSNQDATTPPLVRGTSFTVGSYAAVIQELRVDLQNAVEAMDSVNGTEGWGNVLITGRNPVGSMNPEHTLIATRDWWSVWEDGTTEALTITLGGTAGNICTITAPALTWREHTPGERNGALILELPFTLAESSGDDEISIAFT